MKKNPFITIVTAALLCIVLLGMDPLSVRADQVVSDRSGRYMEDPCSVTFISPEEQTTKFVEHGHTLDTLPYLPEEDDESIIWKWLIEGSEEEFKADSVVETDMRVVAAAEMKYSGVDIMHSASGLLTVTTPAGLQAALKAEYNGSSKNQLKACKLDGSGCEPDVWSLLFTGECDENNVKCYYNLRSSGGKYLRIAGDGVYLSDYPEKMIARYENPETGGKFFLEEPNNAKVRLNLKKKSDTDYFFQKSDSTDDGSKIYFTYTFGEDKPVYEISFDVNGGDHPAPNSVKNYKNSQIILPDYAGSRNGHPFIGWKDSSDRSEGLLPAEYTITDNKTLSAVYDSSNYFVWLDANGGNYTGQPYYDSTYTGEFPSPVRDGYRFLGWKNAEGGGSSYFKNISDLGSLTGDITLKADWKKTTIVKFVKNGQAPKELAIDIPASLSMLDNHDIPEIASRRWMYYTVDGNKAYFEITADNQTFEVPEYDVTFFEVCDEDTEFTVTFNADGGSPDNLTAKGKSDEFLNLSDYAVERDNFTLVGWKDGFGYFYDVDSRFPVRTNEVLTAVWGYTISFDLRGGDGYVEPVSGILGENSAVFPEYNGKRVNNKFIGWIADPAYDPGDAVWHRGDALETDGDVPYFTYYAMYNVTLHLNNNGGGNVTPADKIENLSPWSSVDLSDYKSQSGNKTFFNWSADQHYKGPEIPGNIYQLNGDLEQNVYAVWGSKVTFVKYGEENRPVDVFEGITGSPYETPVQDNIGGGTFKGWTDGSAMYDAGKTYNFPANHLTLYAVMDGEVTVRFSVNGGSADPNLEDIHTKIENKFRFPSYSGSKTGKETIHNEDGTKQTVDVTYNFIGWSDTAKMKDGKYHTVYEVNEEFYIPLNSASNLTFYAVWDLPDDVAKDNVKFGIRLDGTIPYEPANYENSEYSTKIGIDAGNVLKYGVVSGRRWVTANDPSMTKLNPGESSAERYYIQNEVTASVGEDNVPKVEDIQRIMKEFGGFDPESQYVLWYVLKWQGNGEGKNLWHVDGVILSKDLVSLIYNGNFDGMAGNMPLGVQKMRNTQTTVSALVPVRGENWKFTGWNTRADGKGTHYDKGEPITLSADVTVLYAEWVEDVKIVSLQKEWADTIGGVENKLGLRPDRVSVRLQLSNGKTYYRTLTPNSTDADGKPKPWFVSVQIPSTDDKGNDITWEWTEINVPDYHGRPDPQTDGNNVTVIVNELNHYDIRIRTNDVSYPYNGEAQSLKITDHAVVGEMGSGHTISGLKFGEKSEKEIKYLSSAPSLTKVGTINDLVIYGPKITDKNGKNVTDLYTIIYEPGSLEITPRPIVVKADDDGKTYGEPDPEFDSGKCTLDAGYSLGTGDVLYVTSVTRTNKDESAGSYSGVLEPAGIMIKKGAEDVSDCYRITSAPGTFTIRPAAVTVKADILTKVYGSTDALTADAAVDETKFTVTNEKQQDGSWKVTVTNKADGQLVDVFTYDLSRDEGEDVNSSDDPYVVTPYGDENTNNFTVVYKPGALTITPKTITIRPGGFNGVYDGDIHDNPEYNEDEIRAALAGSDSLTAEIEGSIQDVAWAGSEVSSVPNRVKTFSLNGKTYDSSSFVLNRDRTFTVDAGNYIVKITEGELKLAPKQLVITAQTAAKIYEENNPLVCSSDECREYIDEDKCPLPLCKVYYSLSAPLGDGDQEEVTVSGEQAGIGESPNKIDSWTILRGTKDVSRNYAVTTENGQLIVSDRVVIKGKTETKTYDGTPLTCSDISKCLESVTGLEKGHSLKSITITGAQTDASPKDANGEYIAAENVLSDDYVIVDADGNDVTGKYQNVTLIPGELIVFPRSITVFAGSNEFDYDGEEHTWNSFSVPKGALAAGHYIDENSVEITGSRKYKGTTDLVISKEKLIIRNEMSDDVTSNYEIECREGELTINPVNVTVTAASFEKYFGEADKPLTAVVKGTVNGEKLTYELSREPGEEPGTYVITPAGPEKQYEDSYIVAYIPGTLTINYNSVTYSVRKVWDDDNNRDGIRPVSFGMSLRGSDGYYTHVLLSDANRWTASVSDLRPSANGEPVTYTWTEDPMPDGYYAVETIKEGHITTFINRHDIARASSSVTKVWDDKDNAGNTRPASLRVILRGNGNNVRSAVLNEANGWSETADGLPVYENGRPVNYVWFEQSVGNGYYAVSSVTSGGTTTLVNSNLHRLTIHYRYNDGSEARADYTDRLYAGEIFSVDSPLISGFTADPLTAAGVMPAHDYEIIVVYAAEGEEVVRPVVPSEVSTETPAGQKPVPEPRDTEPDADHPLVVPVPNLLVDIGDQDTALGLGEVNASNYGYSLE